MFVLERSGVTWDERFYTGHCYMTSRPKWGSLNEARRYNSKSRAVSMSYRIDDEEGFYTSVEKEDSFSSDLR